LTSWSDVGHATVRGVVGAMAMSGVRNITSEIGLLREPPPVAMAKRASKGMLRGVPKRFRRPIIEVFHWQVGALGGATFAVLPDAVRKQAWAGPAWGVLIQGTFGFVVAPALGLRQAKRPSVREQAALLADHLVYGYVLSDLPRRGTDEDA
jgi:hypothetical protein